MHHWAIKGNTAPKLRQIHSLISPEEIVVVRVQAIEGMMNFMDFYS